MTAMNSNQDKKSRGRPRGSTSFINVRLGDLASRLGNDAAISVSKKWLTNIGLVVEDTAAPIKAIVPHPIEILHPSQPEEPKIQFVIK